jgi:hypothetical protein
VTDSLPPICVRTFEEAVSTQSAMLKTLAADVFPGVVSRCELGHMMPRVGEMPYDMVLRDLVISWMATNDVAYLSD